MYDTIWDRIAAWLSQYTAAAQLAIMLAAVLTIITLFMWVTV